MKKKSNKRKKTKSSELPFHSLFDYNHTHTEFFICAQSQVRCISTIFTTKRSLKTQNHRQNVPLEKEDKINRHSKYDVPRTANDH